MKKHHFKKTPLVIVLVLLLLVNCNKKMDCFPSDSKEKHNPDNFTLIARGLLKPDYIGIRYETGRNINRTMAFYTVCKKWGISFHNYGCSNYVSKDIEANNEEAKQNIIQKFGENWEEKLTHEVEEEYCKLIENENSNPNNFTLISNGYSDVNIVGILYPNYSFSHSTTERRRILLIRHFNYRIESFNKVAKKWGITFESQGQTVTDSMKWSAFINNTEAERNIKRKFGKNWKEKFNTEVDTEYRKSIEF